MACITLLYKKMLKHHVQCFRQFVQNVKAAANQLRYKKKNKVKLVLEVLVYKRNT